MGEGWVGVIFQGRGPKPRPFFLETLLAPSLFRIFFLWENKLVDREQGRYAQKASPRVFRIEGFGFFWFSFSIRIPQSAFRNLQGGRATPRIQFTFHLLGEE
jgi:hypothetical protein